MDESSHPAPCPSRFFPPLHNVENLINSYPFVHGSMCWIHYVRQIFDEVLFEVANLGVQRVSYSIKGGIRASNTCKCAVEEGKVIQTLRTLRSQVGIQCRHLQVAPKSEHTSPMKGGGHYDYSAKTIFFTEQGGHGRPENTIKSRFKRTKDIVHTYQNT